ncbi:hypothetical protein TREMEDRAFT_61766 [Tremella mesenterica DSM 1558]|uniref:uncharacterized protein n=1 Tax=Tremella mesenterica (strain ATCC 24925 / CBS 8224 / DSM 1558 / NBRC 9311 / NRRL Y-6157 / RJB 2259-6 / UBC 559-6) TaxID=578456 RepID=UPI0003F49270|nr:uncharacterized protein TREMEDRAFT_61766 [Tremella mesenterica DSM 1558]EIW70000.1 hypothetical protein TREMEDRAFT_61766 [Tremella mesenterica DSM 1558]
MNTHLRAACKVGYPLNGNVRWWSEAFGALQGDSTQNILLATSHGPQYVYAEELAATSHTGMYHRILTKALFRNPRDPEDFKLIEDKGDAHVQAEQKFYIESLEFKVSSIHTPAGSTTVYVDRRKDGQKSATTYYFHVDEYGHLEKYVNTPSPKLSTGQTLSIPVSR